MRRRNRERGRKAQGCSSVSSVSAYRIDNFVEFTCGMHTRPRFRKFCAAPLKCSDYFSEGSGAARISPMKSLIGSVSAVIPWRPTIGLIPAFIKAPAILPVRYAYLWGDDVPIPYGSGPWSNLNSAFSNPAILRLLQTWMASPDSQEPVTSMGTFGSANGFNESRRSSISFCVSERGVRNSWSCLASWATASAVFLARSASESARWEAAADFSAETSAVPACSVTSVSNWSLLLRNSAFLLRSTPLMDVIFMPTQSSPTMPHVINRTLTTSTRSFAIDGFSGERIVPRLQSSLSSPY